MLLLRADGCPGRSQQLRDGVLQEAASFLLHAFHAVRVGARLDVHQRLGRVEAAALQPLSVDSIQGQRNCRCVYCPGRRVLPQ